MPCKKDKPNKSGYARALHEIIYKDGIVTARELEKRSSYTRQHISAIANEFNESEPGIKCAEEISRILHAEFGETRQMQGMHLPGSRVTYQPEFDLSTLDGDLLKELASINELIVHANDELRETNVGDAKKLLQDAMKEIAHCMTEVENAQP